MRVPYGIEGLEAMLSFAFGQARNLVRSASNLQTLNFFLDQSADAMLGEINLPGIHAQSTGHLLDRPFLLTSRPFPVLLAIACATDRESASASDSAASL